MASEEVQVQYNLSLYGQKEGEGVRASKPRLLCEETYSFAYIRVTFDHLVQNTNCFALAELPTYVSLFKAALGLHK